ncbi:MAG TPA: biopolymer transporter ExbD [Myxococcota bacterium]|nr:biopolymer transporter ExbD [Myxococcota bacterium]HNH46700.1 biopolymer transporter ExbD [Myxococcota bacterium]
MARREIPPAELDLIPVLSLIVHLVPMLLLNVRFMDMAAVPVRGPVLPVVEAPAQEKIEEQEQKLVAIRIEAEGLVVEGADGDPRLSCGGPCTVANVDFAGLSVLLERAKARHRAERRVVIVPRKDSSFELLVRLMDTCRKDSSGAELFPEPLLAGAAP